MVFTLTRRLLPLLAAFVLLTGTTGAADAGWVTITNETGRVVVIQETLAANGQPKRCKPVRLLPGESVREFQPAATVKVEVFDGQQPGPRAEERFRRAVDPYDLYQVEAQWPPDLAFRAFSEPRRALPPLTKVKL